MMELLNGTNLFHLIRRSLNFVDERLVGHGEQVAYIVLKLLEEDGGYDIKQRCSIVFTALLHDIGAYKTEEIDNMIRFETKDVWEHSIYGYLFVKYLSPLSQYAPAILYHHMDFVDLPQYACDNENRKLAQVINLADRAALCLELGSGNQILEVLNEYRAAKFSPEVLNLLEKTLKNGKLFVGTNPEKQTEALENLFHQWTDERKNEQFLQMLVFAIDFRSRFTVAHTFATAAISMKLARNFGIKGTVLQKVKYGAFLHDLGKVGIPLDILESTEKLSDSDMALS